MQLVQALAGHELHQLIADRVVRHGGIDAVDLRGRYASGSHQIDGGLFGKHVVVVELPIVGPGECGIGTESNDVGIVITRLVHDVTPLGSLVGLA